MREHATAVFGPGSAHAQLVKIKKFSSERKRASKKITFYVVISGEYWKKFSPLARKPIKTSDSLIFNAGARAKKGHFFLGENG